MFKRLRNRSRIPTSHPLKLENMEENGFEDALNPLIFAKNYMVVRCSVVRREFEYNMYIEIF